VCAALGAPLRARGQNAPAQDITTQESEPTFKLKVERNLVLVRVVVRDSHGQPVPNLRREDFQLFDSGKPQTISVFSIEEPAARPSGWESEAERQAEFEATPSKKEATAARRYLGLYVDDQHVSWEDLVRTRQAADRYLASALQPGDRVGIFTSSGQNVVDFTDDYGKIKQTLWLLRDRPVRHKDKQECPYILDYQAFKIVEQHDVSALDIATYEDLACRYSNDSRFLNQAQMDAESHAVSVLNMSEYESESALRGLDELVRHIAAFPGERNVVFISAGFLTETLKHRLEQIADRAIRANVIINTFDARGLYTVEPTEDVTQEGSQVLLSGGRLGRKSLMRVEELAHAAEVLSDTAADTGGAYFHNSNDLDEGFRKVGALVSVYYLLGFSPAHLKYDGRFHPLKVSLAAHSPFTLQARRGYFAPASAPTSAATAKADIEEAAMSRDEVHELPVYVSTQFFKFNDTDARLSVLTRVDLRLIRFRKEEGRNLNNLTFVTVLFDRDGKCVSAKEKTLEMRVRDANFEKLLESGLASRASFDLKPGTYLVRQVVRDSEGGQISALNRTVEIPY
jgi:VWFA-related protein